VLRSLWLAELHDITTLCHLQMDIYTWCRYMCVDVDVEIVSWRMCATGVKVPMFVIQILQHVCLLTCFQVVEVN